MTKESQDIWEAIETGNRAPIEVIYFALAEVDLEEIIGWGEITGWWNLRLVFSIDEAMTEQRSDPADVMVLLGVGHEVAECIAKEFPQLPLSIAKPGGFSGFPDGWPPQVVVAQWAAPRPTEFGDGLATALSEENLEIIYQANANSSESSLITSVSSELIAKLAEYPEERFHLNPRLFEEVVAEILFRMGYEVQLTPQSGDKGRDIICNYGTPIDPILMLVECKRYAAHRLVGPEPITRLWFRMFNDNANMAMVVTTSSFQPIAKETAAERGYQISLKEGDDFIKWIRSFKSK